MGGEVAAAGVGMVSGACGKTCLLTLCLAVFSGVLSAYAQTPAVERHVVAGGGGVSGGGRFTITGAVGQAVAAPAMDGGSFAVQGGFWSRYIVFQTPGAPRLTIKRVGANVEISWPANGATGYSLQKTTALGGAAVWMNDTAAVALSGGINKVMIPVRPGNHFFRLAPAQ